MRKYSSIFATPEHKLITSTRELNRWDNLLGFFLNGKVIGSGRIEKFRKRNQKIVNTSSTEIFKKYRNKGHGIELYKALIETARKIGAKQIRSDTNLNKFSERMWRDKLSKIYPVKLCRTRKPCSCCDSTQPRRKYYYINF
jgi:GNAT superfamily N-acetyltransferase